MVSVLCFAFNALMNFDIHNNNIIIIITAADGDGDNFYDLIIAGNN